MALHVLVLAGSQHLRLAHQLDFTALEEDVTILQVSPRPAPTAEEWALAAKYTLKNSKRYRYT